MTEFIPPYLQLPDPTPSGDDVISNDGYFPDLSEFEFEQNYQVTDVFNGKARYLIIAAMAFVNTQIAKVDGQLQLAEELRATYRMCVYAKAMQLICERHTSIDTKTKSEFQQEKKQQMALVYANEVRRLLFVLNGVGSDISVELI